MFFGSKELSNLDTGAVVEADGVARCIHGEWEARKDEVWGTDKTHLHGAGLVCLHLHRSLLIGGINALPIPGARDTGIISKVKTNEVVGAHVGRLLDDALEVDRDLTPVLDLRAGHGEQCPGAAVLSII